MTTNPVQSKEQVEWVEQGEKRTALWRSEAQVSAPKRIMLADDTLKADVAYKLACEGTALLWRGDYHNAKQLLQALARRIDRKPRKANPPHTDNSAATALPFHQHRQAQAQRARILGMILLEIDPSHTLQLRRAPNIAAACSEAYGACEQPYLVALKELLGVIGAHEWRKKGVNIPALNAHIYPYYGVFSPVRGEYVNLVNSAPLPSQALAFDIGTGTGVLAAVLAQRGVKTIIATDQDPRALACAASNIAQLGLGNQITLQQADLFPTGRAPLIVCNPPWIPARPSSPIEYAIYDPNSQMLKGFLNGLASHLTQDGEGWLILSDIAEHLSLRKREQLQQWIAESNLRVIEKHDVKPHHPKTADSSDPLHRARAAETTSLWRLGLTKLV